MCGWNQRLPSWRVPTLAWPQPLLLWVDVEGGVASMNICAQTPPQGQMGSIAGGTHTSPLALGAKES